MKKIVNGIVVEMTEEEVEQYNLETAQLNRELSFKPQNPIAIFNATKTYQKGDLIQSDGGIYKLKTERARGILPADKTYWEDVSLAMLIKEMIKENQQ